MPKFAFRLPTIAKICRTTGIRGAHLGAVDAHPGAAGAHPATAGAHSRMKGAHLSQKGAHSGLKGAHSRMKGAVPRTAGNKAAHPVIRDRRPRDPHTAHPATSDRGPTNSTKIATQRRTSNAGSYSRFARHRTPDLRTNIVWNSSRNQTYRTHFRTMRQWQ